MHPLFSAKSVDGVRAYEMARKAYRAAQKGDGRFDHSAAELLSHQKINITRMELLSYGEPVADAKPQDANELNRFNARINVIDISAQERPHADILVGCTKGTYIRALARDLGESLGSGAFLHSLTTAYRNSTWHAR